MSKLKSEIMNDRVTIYITYINEEQVKTYDQTPEPRHDVSVSY